MVLRFILLFYLSISSVFGQVAIQNNVFASSGSNFSNSSISMDFTIGECLTNSFVSNNLISQGFHQPDVDENTNGIDIPSGFTQIYFSVYPNPFMETFSVEHNSANAVRLKIFDNAGRLVYFESLLSQFTTLNLSNFQSGVYQLVFSDDQQFLSRFSLIKIQ